MEPTLPEGTPQSGFRLVMSFFTIPLLIVLVCVGIFIFFGTLAHDKATLDDTLNEMKTGSATRRWQAAYELSKRLGQERLSPDEGKKLAEELARIYQKETSEEDPRLRRYAILSLSGLAHPSSTSVFEAALSDKDPDVEIYAIWGLGALKKPEATPLLIPFLSHEDPARRKIAAYVLGTIGSLDAAAPLKRLLDDSVYDVQWNAALALAQMRDSSGRQVLHQMLDRTYLDRIPDLNESRKIEVMQNAVKGIVLLHDTSARPLLERLLQTESNPKLTESLRNALNQLK